MNSGLSATGAARFSSPAGAVGNFNKWELINGITSSAPRDFWESFPSFFFPPGIKQEGEDEAAAP